MERFILPLQDGTQTECLLTLPPATSSPIEPSKGHPLIVTIHGGTYSATYFTSSPLPTLSQALGIPIIHTSRPGYGASTPFPPPTKTTTTTTTNNNNNNNNNSEPFIQQSGRIYHEQILPAIWKEFGGARTGGTTSIVLHCHSVGATVGIVAAALHARDEEENRKPAYPLSGMTSSGMSATLHPDFPALTARARPEAHEEGPVSWPADRKDHLMLNPDQALCPASSLAAHAGLDHPITLAEMEDVQLANDEAAWRAYWKGYARDVRAPFFASIGAEDRMLHVGETGLEEYGSAFGGCPRVELSVVPRAPHCIELSCMAVGWLTRVLGFAVECAVAAEMEGEMKMGEGKGKA